jgi:NAD dependent epimerase/dehydratase family enzyme
MRALRDAWGIHFGLPIPEFMIAAGALALQTESELILKSRRVVPGRLLTDGFNFLFPEWPAAARDLVARWRKSG